jgi:hypothetical protein
MIRVRTVGRADITRVLDILASERQQFGQPPKLKSLESVAVSGCGVVPNRVSVKQQQRT